MRRSLTLILLVLCFQLSAQKPKIIVGIIVDQMRQDYLFRYAERFDGGFRRFMDEGYQFKNAHYNYVPTYTAPGHASVYTGTTPSDHGIIGNNWYSKASGLSVYCVSDSDVNCVGGSEPSGKMSPRNLKASTITDELRLTSNFRSKVVGISIKDRGSILPAGHNPTGAYWFDDKTGNFISSTYYMDKLPKWVEGFNSKKLVTKYLENEWKTLKAIDTYSSSTKDNVPYEQTLGDKNEPTFPYDLQVLSGKEGMGLIRSTPWGNTIVMDFALAAINGEGLGNDEFTDFLALSFSSTDYTGHAFAPNSIEIEDVYLRLDRELKRLFDALDTMYGSDYVVFLTSDHGAANNPQYMIDNKMLGGFLDLSTFQKDLNEKITQSLGEGEWIAGFSNDQIFLNRNFIREKKMELPVIQDKIKELVLELPDVFEVYASHDLEKRNGSNRTEILLKNGFNTKMSGDILVRFNPGYISGYRKGGTTHGSGFNYDTHVPILFYGWNIPKGSSVRKVQITDIAPTLSMLLDIALPNAATGVPLSELFE